VPPMVESVVKISKPLPPLPQRSNAVSANANLIAEKPIRGFRPSFTPGPAAAPPLAEITLSARRQFLAEKTLAANRRRQAH